MDLQQGREGELVLAERDPLCLRWDMPILHSESIITIQGLFCTHAGAHNFVASIFRLRNEPHNAFLTAKPLNKHRGDLAILPEPISRITNSGQKTMNGVGVGESQARGLVLGFETLLLQHSASDLGTYASELRRVNGVRGAQ